MYIVAIAWLYVVVLMSLAEGFGVGGSSLFSAFAPPLRFSARARIVLNGTVICRARFCQQ